MAQVIIKKIKSLSGEILIPGDKSTSHRALILGAIAEGSTQINGYLDCADTNCTLQALKAMGVTVEQPNTTQVIIHGVGKEGLKAPSEPLYLGNSGTSMRLLSGLLVAQNFDSELIGDPSLSKRPMGRIIEPLRKMGAVISGTDKGTAPLKIQGGQALKGMSLKLEIASSQLKSCLLLAGLYAEGTTTLEEAHLTRDHTERMLGRFSYPLSKVGPAVVLQGKGRLHGRVVDVPGDLSSAAFFIVAATIVANSELLIRDVGINPTRTGIISILRLMGADITVENTRNLGNEPIADIRVRSAQLRGIEIPKHFVSLAIDEFPILFIAAACAKGKTTLEGVEELRHKESDRITSMLEGLKRLGINICEKEKHGVVVDGGTMEGGTINSYKDHRVAMAFVVAGLVAKKPVIIDHSECVNVSFPNFIALLEQVSN